MTFTTPCARPENDPDDWFIERDGRQYPDEVLVTQEEVVAAVENSNALEGEDFPTMVRRVFRQLEDERIAERLRSRRHAKDKCVVECIFRMHCLGLALDGPNGTDIDYGTRGGYYPEELRQIEKLRRDRAALRLVSAGE